jgi:hypothetical protein
MTHFVSTMDRTAVLATQGIFPLPDLITTQANNLEGNSPSTAE